VAQGPKTIGAGRQLAVVVGEWSARTERWPVSCLQRIWPCLAIASRVMEVHAAGARRGGVPRRHRPEVSEPSPPSGSSTTARNDVDRPPCPQHQLPCQQVAAARSDLQSAHPSSLQPDTIREPCPRAKSCERLILTRLSGGRVSACWVGPSRLEPSLLARPASSPPLLASLRFSGTTRPRPAEHGSPSARRARETPPEVSGLPAGPVGPQQALLPAPATSHPSKRPSPRLSCVCATQADACFEPAGRGGRAVSAALRHDLRSAVRPALSDPALSTNTPRSSDEAFPSPRYTDASRGAIGPTSYGSGRCD